MPSQLQSSEAVYTLDVVANKIPSILFGKGSTQDTLSVDIGLHNDFNKHMTGELTIDTHKSFERIPFTVKSSTTECLGHVSPSENGGITASASQQILNNPPIRECVVGTNNADYIIGGDPDLTYQHNNITARANPTPFTITLKSDFMNAGALSAELGWPFAIPIKDITVDTSCISTVDFQ